MTLEKQLSIRSTEAAELAAALAVRSGKSQRDVVLEALRTFADAAAKDARSEAQKERADLARLRETIRRVHAEVDQIEAETGVRPTSKHDDMYDEFGLPK